MSQPVPVSTAEVYLAGSSTDSDDSESPLHTSFIHVNMSDPMVERELDEDDVEATAIVSHATHDSATVATSTEPTTDKAAESHAAGTGGGPPARPELTRARRGQFESAKSLISFISEIDGDSDHSDSEVGKSVQDEKVQAAMDYFEHLDDVESLRPDTPTGVIVTPSQVTSVLSSSEDESDTVDADEANRTASSNVVNPSDSIVNELQEQLDAQLWKEEEANQQQQLQLSLNSTRAYLQQLAMLLAEMLDSLQSYSTTLLYASLSQRIKQLQSIVETTLNQTGMSSQKNFTVTHEVETLRQKLTDESLAVSKLQGTVAYVEKERQSLQEKLQAKERENLKLLEKLEQRDKEEESTRIAQLAQQKDVVKSLGMELDQLRTANSVLSDQLHEHQVKLRESLREHVRQMEQREQRFLAESQEDRVHHYEMLKSIRSHVIGALSALHPTAHNSHQMSAHLTDALAILAGKITVSASTSGKSSPRNGSSSSGRVTNVFANQADASLILLEQLHDSQRQLRDHEKVHEKELREVKQNFIDNAHAAELNHQSELKRQKRQYEKQMEEYKLEIRELKRNTTLLQQQLKNPHQYILSANTAAQLPTNHMVVQIPTVNASISSSGSVAEGSANTSVEGGNVSGSSGQSSSVKVKRVVVATADSQSVAELNGTAAGKLTVPSPTPVESKSDSSSPRLGEYPSRKFVDKAVRHYLQQHNPGTGSHSHAHSHYPHIHRPKPAKLPARTPTTAPRPVVKPAAKPTAAPEVEKPMVTPTRTHAQQQQAMLRLSAQPQRRSSVPEETVAAPHSVVVASTSIWSRLYNEGRRQREVHVEDDVEDHSPVYSPPPRHDDPPVIPNRPLVRSVTAAATTSQPRSQSQPPPRTQSLSQSLSQSHAQHPRTSLGHSSTRAAGSSESLLDSASSQQPLVPRLNLREVRAQKRNQQHQHQHRVR